MMDVLHSIREPHWGQREIFLIKSCDSRRTLAFQAPALPLPIPPAFSMPLPECNQEAIKATYNRDPPLSIHVKKPPIYLYALPVMS